MTNAPNKVRIRAVQKYPHDIRHSHANIGTTAIGRARHIPRGVLCQHSSAGSDCVSFGDTNDGANHYRHAFPHDHPPCPHCRAHGNTNDANRSRHPYPHSCPHTLAYYYTDAVAHGGPHSRPYEHTNSAANCDSHI